MKKIYEILEEKKGFVPFLVCGDPNLEETKRHIEEAVEKGAAMVELGIPFSDPTAELPEIQAANIRALAGGITTDKVFDFVKGLKADVDIAFVVMTYANVIYSYGAERFFEACKAANIVGVRIPDIPFEEKKEFLEAADKCGIAIISVIAPTSDNRIEMIAREAEGYIYIDTKKTEDESIIANILTRIRKYTDIPCVVGAGAVC